MIKKSKIRIGIIGGNKTGWASVAHIPALNKLDNFELVAVSTTNEKSAQEAAKAFDAKYAFDNANDLVNCPEVDLVVVSVKVPYHFQLAKSALDAGKMVYCEWALGNGTREAEQLTVLAKEKGIRTFIGLQSIILPETIYLKQIIEEGLIGEVLSTSILASGGSWGATLDKVNSYSLDPANGATMLTIPFGHTISAFTTILGPFKSVNATTARRRTETLTVPDNNVLPQLTNDQLAVSGILENGIFANLHYRGGMSAGINFHWEINGTKGDIVITSNSPGYFELIPLDIKYALTGEELRPLEIPNIQTEIPVQPVYGIYHAYQAMYNDIKNDTHTHPSFADGLKFHKLLDQITQSAEEGKVIHSESSC